jgi:hypothetical protein
MKTPFKALNSGQFKLDSPKNRSSRNNSGNLRMQSSFFTEDQSSKNTLNTNMLKIQGDLIESSLIMPKRRLKTKKNKKSKEILNWLRPISNSSRASVKSRKSSKSKKKSKKLNINLKNFKNIR